MLRRADDFFGGAALDDAPEVHHRDFVREVVHHREVVGDEEIRHLALALQVFQDVEHLSLHAHIQGRSRFVTDQEIGFTGQGAGNRDALPLTAGELMGIARQVLSRQAHRTQQRHGFVVHERGITLSAMLTQGFAHDVCHRPARIQAGVGVLKNHLHTLTQGCALGRGVCRMHVHTIDRDVSLGRAIQAHQQAGHGAFAAS